jgi:aspartate/methionine/tyrosine aminotransferase
MLNDRIDLLPGSGFVNLAALLDGVASPEGRPPINMSVGDPQRPCPKLLIEQLVANQQLFGRYTATNGTPDFRAAVTEWLNRHYGLPDGMIEPDRHVHPVAGLREGMHLIARVVVPERKAGQQPAVLIPNPYYHPYEGAAIMAGAEPVFVPAYRDNGFMPDFAALDEATLARAAAVYLCSPSNPEGAAADMEYLCGLIRLARRFDFTLLVDECYAEIYYNDRPAGALEACARLGGGMDNVVVFHSLSKRSSAPGLRSGFVAGDAAVIRQFQALRNYGGVAVSQPVLAASAALWREPDHVIETRAFYQRNVDAAERILGNRFGFYRPAGSMFLWLDVGDSEAATRRAWAAAGVRTMPGRYMSRDVDGGENPGADYIRVALVHDIETTKEGLARLSEVL